MLLGYVKADSIEINVNLLGYMTDEDIK